MIFNKGQLRMVAPITLSGKKILVTGASGFIGSHLCKGLIQQGANVYGTSRYNNTGHKNSINWLQGDLSDFSYVQDIITNIKPNYIFHLASYVKGSRDLKHILPTYHSNLTSTVNLLTAATKIGCDKIIIAGSMEEPDSAREKFELSSPYAATKWASSGYAQLFYSLYQTPVVISRIFMVYGPGQKDLNKLIPYVILSLLKNQPPKLSSGTRQVDWIYIDDVIDGLMAILFASNVINRKIDLGTGKSTSIQIVVEKLFNIMNSKIDPPFGTLEDRPMEQIRYANVEETCNQIGWKPVVPLEKGLALTVDWYKNFNVQADKKYNL